jgi:hypothetical protein
MRWITTTKGAMTNKREAGHDVPGLEFYEAKTRKQMKYVYPDSEHWARGWILYKHPDGQWVTLRKATQDDIDRISAAVVEAHHAG